MLCLGAEGGGGHGRVVRGSRRPIHINTYQYTYICILMTMLVEDFLPWTLIVYIFLILEKEITKFGGVKKKL